MKKIAKQGIFPIIMVMGRNDMAIPKEESYTKEFEKWFNSPILTEEQKAELVSIKDNEELKEFWENAR